METIQFSWSPNSLTILAWTSSTVVISCRETGILRQNLEAKLAKARHIKQGMMQELMMGRIRLA